MKFKATGKHSLTLFKSSPTLMEGLKAAASSFAAATADNKDIPPVPDAKDFYSFEFRHISATIVGAGTWKATDFRREGVLQASTPLLRNKPAYTNHYISVGNEIGHVGETRWVEAYKNDAGEEIPAGIEAPFVIDSVLNPKLVRQLNSPVPPVNCASVTVDFDWEASHEFENEYDFYRHLGEMIDDRMVCRVATKITAYYESSLVWLGADPFAKMLVNGKVQDVNILQEASGYEVAADGELKLYKEEHHFFAFDGPVPAGVSFSAAPKKPATPPQPQPIPMDKELLAFLAAHFGVTEEVLATAKKDAFAHFTAVKTEEYNVLLEEHKDRGTQVQQLTSDLTTRTKERDDFSTALTTVTKERDQFKLDLGTANTKLSELEPLAKYGQTTLDSLRLAAEKAYTTFSKGKPDSAIVEALKTDDAVKLAAQLKMWGSASLTEFGATCTNCKSGEHIELRSSIADEELNAPKQDQNDFSLASMVRR